MGDSQEFTIENFNSDRSKSNRYSVGTHAIVDIKNKPTPIMKDISVPSVSTKRSYDGPSNADSIIEYKEKTQRDFEPVSEKSPSPSILSERMARVMNETPLNGWIPTQFVSSPESIGTPVGTPTISILGNTRSVDQRSIYLYDLKDSKQEIIGDNLLDLDGFKDEILDISNDSLNIPTDHDNYFVKKNLSMIFEITEESNTRSHENNQVAVKNILNSFHKPNFNPNMDLTYDQDSYGNNKENLAKRANSHAKPFPMGLASFNNYSTYDHRSMTIKNKDEQRKPFINMVNWRSTSIAHLKKFDSQIGHAQKQLLPEVRSIRNYRKKSKLLKTNRSKSILK
jgi:hypothetical protein